MKLYHLLFRIITKRMEVLYLERLKIPMTIIGYIGVSLIAWLVLSNLLTPIPLGIPVNGTTEDKPSFFIQFPQDHISEIGTLSCIFIGLFVIYTVIVEITKKLRN